MLTAEIEAGEELITFLSQLAAARPEASRSRSTDYVRFTRLLDGWQKNVEQQLLAVLGQDPYARFSYLVQVFREQLFAAGHQVGADDVASLEGVVGLLKHFRDRMDPGRRTQKFDWSAPITRESPTPDLAEIEAKRWEFHDALLREGEAHPTQAVDPIAVAASIGLHEFHAREFLMFLARIGRLRRDRLAPEWQTHVAQIDSENVSGSHDQSRTSMRRLRVFVCHSSKDKHAARELSRFVRDLGHDPWLDDERLLPGHDWDYEIRQALKEADIVLICLSDSMERGYVQKEIRRARDIADEFPVGARFLIPVRLTDCEVPDGLERYQYVDLFRANGSERLAAALTESTKAPN